MALFGIASTSNLLARYAAADVSPAAQRGRAMGLIVWGSTVGSIIGPNLMAPALSPRRAARRPGAASAFLISVAGYARGRAPDLLLPAARSAGDRPPGPGDRRRGPARRRRAPRSARSSRDVRVQIALATLSVSQFVMISTTSTSPLYLHDQGHSVGTIGVGGLAPPGRHVRGLAALGLARAIASAGCR